MFEDLCGEPLPAIGFEGSRAGVVGCRQAVEIPYPVQGERGDPLPVERGERQAGIETAPAPARLLFVRNEALDRTYAVLSRPDDKTISTKSSYEPSN